MLDKKQIKKLAKEIPDDKRYTERVTRIACPLCFESGWAFYPYGEFTIQHEHPVRRYWYFLRTGRIYSKWLKEYWADVERYTGKTRENYAIS